MSQKQKRPFAEVRSFGREYVYETVKDFLNEDEITSSVIEVLAGNPGESYHQSELAEEAGVSKTALYGELSMLDDRSKLDFLEDEGLIEITEDIEEGIEREY